jgi:uncharacterized membrane protein
VVEALTGAVLHHRAGGFAFRERGSRPSKTALRLWARRRCPRCVPGSPDLDRIAILKQLIHGRVAAMGHIALQREIDAPVERVFAYVDDHRNTVRYMRGLTLWSPTTAVVHGKDAEFEVVMKAGPANLHSVVRITTWTENRSIAWRSIEGFQQKGRWGFSERGDHTAVTLDMEYEFGGGIAGRMLGKAAEPAVRHNLEQSVNALKEQTERLRPAAAKRAAAKPAAPRGERPAAKPRRPPKSA